MSDSLLLDAIRNNAEWCDAFVRASGGAAEFRESWWWNGARSPELYPNLITLSRLDRTQQLDAIQQLLERGLGTDWGVKDSFAALDLKPLGFRLLFDAQWFGIATAPLSEEDEEDDIDWFFVEDEETFDEWQDAWGEESDFFPPALLEDPNIAFAFARTDETISAGAIFNRDAGVCGFSNFFVAADEQAQFFPSALAKARAWSGGLTVVGYTSEAALDELAFEALERLGPLRIWLFGQ